MQLVQEFIDQSVEVTEENMTMNVFASAKELAENSVKEDAWVIAQNAEVIFNSCALNQE